MVRINFILQKETITNNFVLCFLLAKALPLSIPARPVPNNIRPMRSSVEGLNQEIEKLVLHQDQPHTCRPETNLVYSRSSIVHVS